MTTWKLEHNDILEWAKGYTGPKAMACLCDPPYHLTSIAKRFSKADSKPPKGGVYKRTSAGFMGSVWDSTDDKGMGIAFDPATWAALAQHLYPGAFIMAFGGSRGYHRMATAMEDAGLIIHPAMGWLTLSGFPKATRIKGYGSPWFKGHRYGLQALKPAFEFIAVAQVPYSGRPVDSIVATGAGALNIDGGRIAANGENFHRPVNHTGLHEGWDRPWRHNEEFLEAERLRRDESERKAEGLGRWPANFLLTCCCDPTRTDQATHQENCPVRLFDEQAGESVSKAAPRGGTSPNPMSWTGERADGDLMAGYNDSGPASRMFHQATWQYEVAEQLANAAPVRYEPKSSTAERNAGFDDFEEVRAGSISGGGGLNSTNDHAYSRNPHPTVKPLSLAIYLSRLLAPPAAYAPRRLLVPFSGSGSEICGAILSGQWESITGIEMSAEYCKVAEARCKFWASMADKVRVYGLDSILQKYGKKEEVPAGQMSLF